MADMIRLCPSGRGAVYNIVNSSGRSKAALVGGMTGTRTGVTARPQDKTVILFSGGRSLGIG
jgi:hypothetical protein